MMNDVAEFAASMRSYASALTITERLAGASGLRWIDIRMPGHFSAISWRPGQGFGFYDEAGPGYGHETPLQTIADPEAAAAHEAQVLRDLGWPLSRRPIVAGAIRIQQPF